MGGIGRRGIEPERSFRGSTHGGIRERVARATEEHHAIGPAGGVHLLRETDQAVERRDGISRAVEPYPP
jgi:hypothetical protein